MGVKAEGVIKQGLVDNEIVDFVEKDKEIKMIVMGAYGKNFIERQIIGSKTEGVLRKMMDLDVPLVVVPCPPCVE
ncbi:MAG: universal stress protein [Dehalococcoidia bacterium]